MIKIGTSFFYILSKNLSTFVIGIQTFLLYLHNYENAPDLHIIRSLRLSAISYQQSAISRQRGTEFF